MNERKLFLGCFFIVLVIISWGDFTHCSGADKLPWPPRIVLTALVFSMLDLASGLLGTVAPLVGIGFVLAAIVNNKFSTNDCTSREALSTAQPSDVLTSFTSGPNSNAIQQPGQTLS